MYIKKLSRQRRARKTRSKISNLGYLRLCVHKTNRHLYAQIVESTSSGDMVVASASTLQKNSSINTKNIDGATSIGRAIAEQAIAKGIEKVAFDRSGYKYHGRVRQLAASAREVGLKF